MSQTKKSLQDDMLPSYRTMKYKSPIWGGFSCLGKVK